MRRKTNFFIGSLVLSFMTIYFYSCNTKKQEVSCIVKEITIHHVIKKRNGCNIKTISFEVEVQNHTDQEISLDSLAVDYCPDEEDAVAKWFIGDSLISRLIVNNYEDKERITIASHHKNIIKFRTIRGGLFGRSLAEMLTYYLPIIKDRNMRIEYPTRSLYLTIKTDHNTQIVFKLDDKIILPQDTANLKKEVLAPSLIDPQIPIVEEEEVMEEGKLYYKKM